MNDGKQVPLPVTDRRDEAGAWAAVHALLTEIKGAVVKPGVKPGTVAELVPLYLADAAARVKPETIRQYAAQLRWLARHLGDQAAGAVEVAAIVAAAARESGWGDTHRANHLATCGAFMRWVGVTDRIPLPPKPSRGADAVIPEPVYRAILHETRGDFRALVEFMWLTGCRPGEATGLVVEAVQWDARTAILKRHKTHHRTGKTRVLYLGTDATAVLAGQRERHPAGLLFQATMRKRFSLQALTMRFGRVSDKVGHKVTSYCFRHTFATRALMAGIPDVEVAALLGHTSTAMIHRHYSHLAQQAKRLQEAADKISGKKAG